MKNYLRFLSPVMLLLMAVMFGGGKIYASEITYTVKSSSSVTPSVSLTGVTASFFNTYSTGTQLTKDKSMTLTISGFTGKVTAFKLNQAATNTGTGSLLISINGNNVVDKTFAARELGTSADSYTVRTYNVETPVVTTGDIVIKLSATNKSLYCKSFTLVYDDEEDTRTATTLSFGSDIDNKIYNLTIGDTFEAPIATLTPFIEDASVIYSSDNTAVADVDANTGAVKLGTSVGTAVITAKYEGNTTYKSSICSYSISLAKPTTIVDGYFDFNNPIGYGSGLEPSSSYHTEKTTFTAGNVQLITQTKSNTSGFRWYNGSTPDLRLYKGTNFSLKVKEGYHITSIVMAIDKGIKSLSADCGDFVSGVWNGNANTINFINNGATIEIETIQVKYTKDETLTTSARGYATYSADYAVNYSKLGLTAYTLTVDESKNTVTAKEFTGVVPAGGAVLVKGTASKVYTLTPATTEGDATFTTALQTGATTADGTQYGFTSKFGTPAFAQVASGQDIPAKKGYIVLTGASAAKYSICFGDEATGIQTIEAASAANAAMYNLAGQRVDKAYKGIVIVNGKKYLNK